MEPEIAMLKAHVQDQKEVTVNPMVTVYTGTLHGKNIVFASAGVGMVAAASTATLLLTQFKVEAIVFTGVAGGLKEGQKVGDIVLAEECLNYDMNVTAFVPFPGAPEFARGQLPFSPLPAALPADPALLALAKAAPAPTKASVCSGVVPTVRTGRLVTGSEFVTVPRKKELAAVWEQVGDPEAVEMECAAVAQVCGMFKAPFLGLRALSDNVEGDANADFNAFTQEAADNLWPIVDHIIAQCE